MMTEKIKPTAKKSTTNGSTLKPWASSVNNFNIVAEEPPAPAALVDKGAWEASLAFLSETLFLLAADLKPPGATEDEDCGVSKIQQKLSSGCRSCNVFEDTSSTNNIPFLMMKMI